MVELATFLFLVTASLLIVRVGAAALEKTGLAREASLFQAQSAFMGVGFTTSEAESVVGHPVRRRIIRLLMLLGFGAVTSALGTVVVTFARSDQGMRDETKVLILVVGVALLWIGARIPALDRMLDRVIGRALERATSLRVIDFEEVLNLNKGYSVASLSVDPGSWLENRTLRQLALADEGILVLSISRRSGLVIGSPASSTPLEPGDHVLAYGLEEDLARLRARSSGDAGDEEHALGVERQRLRLLEERVEDRISTVREQGSGREQGAGRD